MKLGATVNTILGSSGFFPLPSWLRWYLLKKTPSQAMLYTARLMNGVDLSFTVPDDVGCAESVTRICRMLFGDDVIPGTYTLMRHYERYPLVWKEISAPADGCVVIAATGTGNGSIQGHVGIYDRGRIWSNNSATGRFDSHFSHLAFVDRYQKKGGIRVRYFVRISK